MKTIAITGATGMLGSMVYRELKNKYNLVLIYRDKVKFQTLQKIYGSAENHRSIQCNLSDLYEDYHTGFQKFGKNTTNFIEQIGEIDGIVNCAGITKPNSLTNPVDTFFINGGLPHLLSSIYKENLIHITSDCAFNGLEGAPYDEKSVKTPNDLYGLSKIMGEPESKSLVLRTSIIGPEISGFQLFLEWFKKQEGKTISGFTNHYWNGVTTKAFAHICGKIITDRSKYPLNGLFHIFSTSVSKYEMIEEFKRKYEINVSINKAESMPVDRRLNTIHSLCHDLKIPSFTNMLADL